MFSVISNLFNMISEGFKSLAICKERQSETDVLKSKRTKSKAVDYAEKLIFYVDENYDVADDKKYQRLRRYFFKYN